MTPQEIHFLGTGCFHRPGCFELLACFLACFVASNCIMGASVFASWLAFKLDVLGC